MFVFYLWLPHMYVHTQTYTVAPDTYTVHPVYSSNFHSLIRKLGRSQKLKLDLCTKTNSFLWPPHRGLEQKGLNEVYFLLRQAVQWTPSNLNPWNVATPPLLLVPRVVGLDGVHCSELTHLVVPAPSLSPQVTGPTRYNPRLLEQSSIQRHSLYNNSKTTLTHMQVHSQWQQCLFPPLYPGDG